MSIPTRGCPDCGHDATMHASLAPGAGGPRLRWTCLDCGYAFDTTKNYWAVYSALGHHV